ncbi:peptidoglycan D,D-transpeptidase FtsI family protein [[Phormidium] sp. LEGE 05292]|uniref:peptidoglycan D,D-transpeptidase FtsI family protein n=1 Tax=[Phormidium] sp. LEGE 05292 TaxID=767427 RepID=UPI001D15DAB9|nr:penicillin-binding protein 2 [Phormidium sp. LEGE 05292]
MAKSNPSSFSDMKQLGANYLPNVIRNPKEIRLVLVWIILLLGGLGLCWNLFRLQVTRRPFLERYAKQQQEITLRPFVPRRTIVDRNNNVLAVDRPVYTLYAHPKIFRRQTKEQIANQLAPLIGISATELLSKFNSAESGIRVKDKIVQEIADKITAIRQDGLELIQSYSRLYPAKETAADIVGYVDDNHKGQAGLEYSRETLLERTLKVLRLNRAGNGAVMPDYAPEGLFNADDNRLRLTIDVRLQRAARAALKTKMAEFKAKRGTVIVMDVRDGSLLALVAEPTYNPNEFFNYDKSLYKNWAVTDLYEPGSTFKPINVAIALENKSIQPDSVFRDGGAIKVSNKVIRNAHGGGYGTINITKILQVSSNVGMVQVMQTLKPTVYYNWLKRLGVGAAVESDLPFRTNSKLKPERIFTSLPIEPATAAFGQGFSITPLHLVRMTATLANGGKLVTPHVIQGLYNSKDQLTWEPTLPPSRSVFSPNTAKTVVEMMESVVKKGTGKAAQIPGYRIGGKTGTAQKASPKGGYSDAKVTSFVAILPLESPRYVVAAVVDEPKGGSGAATAAPVVKSVMQSLITIEKIPPTNPKVLEASQSEGSGAGEQRSRGAGAQEAID